jgi:hypothetical protein
MNFKSPKVSYFVSKGWLTEVNPISLIFFSFLFSLSLLTPPHFPPLQSLHRVSLFMILCLSLWNARITGLCHHVLLQSDFLEANNHNGSASSKL